MLRKIHSHTWQTRADSSWLQAPPPSDVTMWRHAKLASSSPTSKVAHPPSWGAVIGVSSLSRQPYKAKPKGTANRVGESRGLVNTTTNVEEDYSKKKKGGSGGRKQGKLHAEVVTYGRNALRTGSRFLMGKDYAWSLDLHDSSIPLNYLCLLYVVKGTNYSSHTSLASSSFIWWPQRLLWS